MWALTDLASWCTASNGNQAGITRKLAAIQYFHPVDVDVALPIRSLLIKSTLKGISRSHTLAGTRPRVRLPIKWDSLIAGQDLIPT